MRNVEDSHSPRQRAAWRPDASRNAAQAVTLLEAQQEFEFDALIGGARRDEEKARAKERVFSHRDTFGAWRPRAQRPELWGLFNRRLGVGEHMRVFPLSNWTEADVWAYIAQEEIALPSLYYAHARDVVRRDGLLFPVTDLTPAAEGDAIEHLSVRFRTVGDVTCTCPVESAARDTEEVLTETLSDDGLRARRHAHGRSRQRRRHGTAQDRGLLLMDGVLLAALRLSSRRRRSAS